MRALRFAIVVLGMIACGGADEIVPDASTDGAIDGRSGCGDCDAPLACMPWAFETRPAVAAVVLDDATPVADRTFRVQVDYDGGAFDERAMPTVAIGTTTVTITANVFALLGGGGGGPRQRSLLVPLVLPAGTWTITATGAPPLTVTIGPAPPRACGGPGECQRDCDCDQAAGERCLTGAGLGGPFRACARACEVDRDCGGDGTCQSIPDGLTSTCQDPPPECGALDPCSAGFACNAGACEPTFVLASGSRHACGCDADCDAGLRCVGTVGNARCQGWCPTGGPWCQGAHVCGTVADDLSGLATTDSVCGFLGE